MKAKKKKKLKRIKVKASFPKHENTLPEPEESIMTEQERQAVIKNFSQIK